MKEVFEYASQGRISSRNNCPRRKVLFRKTNMAQKSLVYSDLSVWSKLLSSMKKTLV